MELPERRGKKHGLKISSLKKNQDDFQLEIEVKGKKRAFSFSFSKNNDKYTFYSDTLPDHHAKKVWIENIRFDPENKAFEIGKSSSNTLTSYREVMSYWFNIKRPNMEYADQEVKPDSPQGIFLDFLSKNWPVYDVDGWKNVDYFIKDIFEDLFQEEENPDPEESEGKKTSFQGIRATALIVTAFLRKYIINGIYENKESFWKSKNGPFFLEGSETIDIFCKRPEVCLDTKKFNDYLVSKQFHIPERVIDILCTALNAGDNIILTGSPGCGKTTLAQHVIDFSEYEGITATAAPTWTTDELIGRYIPDVNKDSNTVLKFQKGYFLEAISDSKWLLIDEMNRAPIDQCFGELFTVLSGHSVSLPFFIQTETGEKRLGIAATKEECKREDMVYIKLPPSFRLLCTMNDIDKDKLDQLSFALQRRFHIIRLETPEAAAVRKKVEEVIEKKNKEFKNTGLKLKFKGKQGKNLDKSISEEFNTICEPLFYGGNNILFSRNIIGMAQMINIITFALRRLYSIHGETMEETIEMEVRKGVAYGLVTKVYPQLTNFCEETLLAEVVRNFKDCFKENENILGFLKQEFERQFQYTFSKDIIEEIWQISGKDDPQNGTK